jgi:hypothetical protein
MTATVILHVTIFSIAGMSFIVRIISRVVTIRGTGMHLPVEQATSMTNSHVATAHRQTTSIAAASIFVWQIMGVRPKRNILVLKIMNAMIPVEYSTAHPECRSNIHAIRHSTVILVWVSVSPAQAFLRVTIHSTAVAQLKKPRLNVEPMKLQIDLHVEQMIGTIKTCLAATLPPSSHVAMA